MYSGSFYPFPNEEIRWAWWARNIYVNRYIGTSKPVYEELFSIVKDKDYFVITTNVDHLFQKSGFDKKSLFYMQGDYGLFQSIDPSNQKTYDNEKWVIAAMQTLKSLQKGILDMTQHFRAGYGKERMTRSSELCVYGIRGI